MTVAYILDRFPTVSETFVLNEIVALEQQCVEVIIYSRFKGEDGTFHEQARDLVKSMNTLDTLSKTAKVLAGFQVLLKSPIRFIRTMSRLRYRSIDNPWLILGFCSFLAREIKGRKVQHIHSHFAGQAAELAMYVSFLTGISYSFTTHGYDIFDFPPGNYSYRSRFAKFVVAVSEYNRRYLIEHFSILPEKIRVVRCGVDTRLFRRTEPLLGDTILCVARLRPVKGLQYLIEACSVLKEKGIALECNIVGEGSERPALEDMISRYGLGQHVRLMGARSQVDIFSYLNTARLFVLPSLSEGIPVSLMEAMAMELPVVATQITGIPELVTDGMNGFLVAPRDPEALAARIEQLLSEPSLAVEFGKNGRRKVEDEFDLKKNAKSLEELFVQNERNASLQAVQNRASDFRIARQNPR